VRGPIGRWRAGKPELTADCQAFRGTLGTKVVVCRPADPEAKGLDERANGYLETSFLPGRRFASPAGFNAQLADGNDYSVHPAAIGRRIEVTAGLDRVRAWCGGQLAADHERAWAWHQVITDPEHKAAAAAMRRQRVGMLRPAGPEPEVEQRSLAVYDALAGGDGEGAA
jgi:hypothetical protein